MARKKRRLELEAAKEKERQAAAGITADGGDPSGGDGGQRGSVAEVAGGAADMSINGTVLDTDASMLDATNVDDNISPTTAPAPNDLSSTQSIIRKPPGVSKLKFEIPQDDPSSAAESSKGDPQKAAPPTLKKEMTNGTGTATSRDGANSTDGEPDAEGEEDDELAPQQQQGVAALNGFKSPPVLTAR